MASHRLEKVESLILEEISWIFLHKMTEMELGFVTITGVKVSADLRIAKVYISVFDKERRPAVLKKIETNNANIRSELAARVSLRFVPELKFFLDESIDHVERINELIKEIHKNDQPENNQ